MAFSSLPVKTSELTSPVSMIPPMYAMSEEREKSSEMTFYGKLLVATTLVSFITGAITLYAMLKRKEF